MIIHSNDESLICQFNMNYYHDLPRYLAFQSEKIFYNFGYEIKKIYWAKEKKLWAPPYKRYKVLLESDEFLNLDFQSDFNRKDFEPQTRLDIDVNTRYINSLGVIKYSIIINDKQLLSNIWNTYKMLIEIISKIKNISISGYSFLLPNYYGAVSFASGILRKMNMPCSLNNLASWYSSSDLVNSTIGLINCFSDLTEYQNQFLMNIFGKDNVIKFSNITIFYNSYAENLNIADYIVSDNYNEICNMLKQKLPFKRHIYHKEL